MDKRLELAVAGATIFSTLFAVYVYFVPETTDHKATQQNATPRLDQVKSETKAEIPVAPEMASGQLNPKKLELAAPIKEKKSDATFWIENFLRKSSHQIDPVGHWIGCENLIPGNVFDTLALNDQDYVQQSCGTRYREPAMLRLFLSNFALEKQASQKSAEEFLEAINPAPRGHFENQQNCPEGDKDVELNIWEGFVVSQAAKAVILGGLESQAGLVLANIRRGVAPEEALVGTSVEQLANASDKGNSRSLRLFYSMPFGDMIGQVTDDDILRVVRSLKGSLAQDLRIRVKKFARTLKRKYPFGGSGASTKISEIRNAFSSRSFNMLVTTPVVGGYPKSEVFVACGDVSVRRFWARRYLEGNHVRMFGILTKVIDEL